MLQFLVVLGSILVSLPQETNGRLYVNGKPCARGVGMMYVPPGTPRPNPCPPHVDSRGSCWFGDMGIDRFSCIGRLGMANYTLLPLAVNILEDIAPPGFEVPPPGFEVAPPGPPRQ